MNDNAGRSIGEMPQEHRPASASNPRSLTTHNALRALDYNVNEAAHALGISRATSYRKFKKHDLPVQP